MSDQDSDISSGDEPTGGGRMCAWIVSFIIKSLDTCCELLKTVKIGPSRIQNPTEDAVDVEVDSKGQGKWSVKYNALDFKVGSLSDGTDTVSYDMTESSVTSFFKNLTGNQVSKVEYFPLDCDTMHIIGDVVVTEERKMAAAVAEVETNEDIVYLKAEAKEDEEVVDSFEGEAKKNEGDGDGGARRGTQKTADGSRGLYEGSVDGKAEVSRNRSHHEDELEVMKEGFCLTKDLKTWLKDGLSGSMHRYSDQSSDSHLEVCVETSMNPGFCRLKLNKNQPVTKNQEHILSLFKSSESGYLAKPKPNIVKDLVTSYVKKCDLKPDVAIMVNEPKYKILCFLSSKGPPVCNQNNSGTKDTVLAVGLDWVPCLHMAQWPKQAEEWRTRERKSNWPQPTKELIDKVVKAGCHIVPKSHLDNQGGDTEWQISFSEAESIIVKQLSETQRLCFRMFKMVTQLHCKVVVRGKEEYPSSYSLKTLFLWACEEIRSTTWEKNLRGCFLALFDKLAEALEKGAIPGYFIREMNVIGHIKPMLIKRYLRIVHRILREPKVYLEATWKAIVEPKLGWTFERMFGELIRSTDKNEESHCIAKSRSCLNLALMINDYICQGAVEKNALLTKMTQAIYDRQRPNNANYILDMNSQVTEADDMVFHIIEELLEDCRLFSSEYHQNPAVFFGINSQAFLLAGEVDYAQGKIQEAKENFEKAIKILASEKCKVAPRSMSRVYTHYAKCLTALKLSTEPLMPSELVMEQYQKALKLDLNNIEARVYMVMSLDKTGKKEAAAKLIKNAVSNMNQFGLAEGTLIPVSRGDLKMLDAELSSEVKSLLNWSVKFPQIPYGKESAVVPRIFVHGTVIISHLYMKGQKITKATLKNELQPWVKMMADAGKSAREDCRYIAISLLGIMNYNAVNHREALKLLQSQANTGHCSDRVTAHLDLLRSLLK